MEMANGLGSRHNAVMKTWRQRFVVVCPVLAAVVLALTGGCSLSHLDTPERREHGLVIILPGIEGPSYWNHNIARGLEEGGVRNAIQIFDWGSKVPGGMLINIADYERNKLMAGELRDHIVQFKRRHPASNVHLIGHSGGGGIAIMAAELLPEDTRLATIILLAPALSPEYDLRPALRRVSVGIFNYYSHLDAGFLGVGTSVAGTMDRRHTPAAGAVGFTLAAARGDSDRALYRKLQQIAWHRDMGGYGHMGDHMGWTQPSFVRRYLAPLLRDLNTWPGGPSMDIDSPNRDIAALDS